MYIKNKTCELIVEAGDLWPYLGTGFLEKLQAEVAEAHANGTTVTFIVFQASTFHGDIMGIPIRLEE